jgi:hypothetical protein
VAAPKKYPDELRARAVRLYRESDPKPTIRRLAEQLGVHHGAYSAADLARFRILLQLQADLITCPDRGEPFAPLLATEIGS